MTSPSSEVSVAGNEPDGSSAEIKRPTLTRGRLRHWQRAGRSRWERVPLTGRLLAIVVVLLVASLTVTGWGTQHVLRTYLIDKLDNQLEAAAGAYQNAIQQGFNPGSNGQLSPYLIAFTYADGTTAQNPPMDRDRSGNQGPQPKLPTLSYQQAVARNGQPFTVRSGTGPNLWRVVAIPFQDAIDVRSGKSVSSVMIALPLNDVADSVNRVRLLIVEIGLVVTLACAGLGWLAIRRAFIPLDEVEGTAAAIAAGDLSRRVPEHPASTEVGRLTSALNGMLAQIESAFRQREASEARTRRFAADASHELRTPLAAIRGFAELYRQGAVSEPDDVARTMSRIEGEARRMGTLVEDLLLLARLDEQRPGRHDPVDLAVLAGDAVHDARALDPDRTVQMVGLRPGGGPEPSVVTGDDNRLRQVVANLVANAVRHTPPRTPIEVAVGLEPGVAVLEVRDHGSGLSPEHAIRVFERFYRVDSSRSRGRGGGSGLGLSIVAAVVSAHSGRVGVAPTPGGGATFRVELPAAPARSELPADAPESAVLSSTD